MSKARNLGSLGEDILKHALNTIQSEDNVHPAIVNLYLRHDDVPANGTLTVAGVTRNLPTSTKTVHVYADLAPLHNWGHPVRHLFYDTGNGALVHSEYHQFPPDDFDAGKAYEPFHVPLVHQDPPLANQEAVLGQRFFVPSLASIVGSLTFAPLGVRYAILFSGNSNNRHLNDLEFLYRVLIGKYKYDPKNIIVLNFDGTLNYNGGPQPVGNWPGNNTPYQLHGHINGPGNLKAFDAAFATVAGKLKPQDSLLIHTNNHGGDASSTPSHQPWLCGYPNYGLVYTATDFGVRIKSLPKHNSLIVGMEQCFSGGFMSPTIVNSPAVTTSFASAVPANMSSMGGPTFDPWAVSWIAAFNNANPNGTPLSLPVPANPSTRQAFDYSNAVHVPGDLPQFSDKPAGSGTGQHL